MSTILPTPPRSIPSHSRLRPRRSRWPRHPPLRLRFLLPQSHPPPSRQQAAAQGLTTTHPLQACPVCRQFSRSRSSRLPLPPPRSQVPVVGATRHTLSVLYRAVEAHLHAVSTCGVRFLCSFSLPRSHSFCIGHLRSHTEERPYVCEWPGCKKGFARQHDCKYVPS